MRRTLPDINAKSGHDRTDVATPRVVEGAGSPPVSNTEGGSRRDIMDFFMMHHESYEIARAAPVRYHTP